MRIEQYFLMTDYALCKVIVNGDSPLPMRTVDGNSYKNVKSLMKAIEKRFGGNKESKKVQKTLIRQQYENFNGNSSEGLDQIYDRLQKLISQLEIHGETIFQENLNLKLLKSLPSEWKTHTLIWRNKLDLETLSMDDLYNNLKIYETKIKGSLNSSQNSQVDFVSSNSSGSTNQAHGSNSANTDSMSDVVIYSFFANQSNIPQLDNENLQQIDADDLEEMDLKCQMAMLTMRARRFLKKTRRNIGANGSDTIRFDKTKVECYSRHKRGHFVRKCRAQRENRNREPVWRNMTIETTDAKALVAQDGFGYDWSDQAEDEPTNFALMAYTSSGSSSSSNSDTEKEKAKKERDDLKLTLEKFENPSKNLSKLLDSQVCDKFKTGVGYDSQVFDSQVFDSQVYDSQVSDSQVNDKYKTSEGYHEVPPPYTGNFMPPKPNLILADVDEYIVSKTVTSVPAVVTNEAKTRNLLSKKSIIGKPNTLEKTVKVLEYTCKHNKGQLNGQRVVRPVGNNTRKGNPQLELQEKGVVDSGCSRHMTRNMSYLSEYEEIDGGYVAFRGYP
nr:hypothetical protein [Tanacetum cinerariifolium]